MKYVKLGKTARTLASLSALAVLVSGALLVAGPLNPPAGPVLPTYKTLTQVEPRISIDATNTPGDAGSVYKITQPGSYYLTGNLTGQAGKTGIRVMASCVTIDGKGFDIAGVAGAGNGIDCAVAISPPIRNVEVRNACIHGWQNGIDFNSTVATNCIIDDIRASDNSSRGIAAGNNSIITKCVAFQNGGFGTTFGGIICGSFSTIIGCTCYANGGDGIFANTGCTIQHCNLSQNIGAGIQVTTNCKILENNCIGNGYGPNGGTPNILAGIANGTDGNNRIEGNNCTGGLRGIQVASTGNFIVRNICSNNTVDWLIAAANCFAPIFDRRNVTNGADVNGFSASGTLEGDCCSNISY